MGVLASGVFGSFGEVGIGEMSGLLLLKVEGRCVGEGRLLVVGLFGDKGCWLDLVGWSNACGGEPVGSDIPDGS